MSRSIWVPGLSLAVAAAASLGDTRASSRAFHELHLAGEPNAAGLSVLGVRKDDVPHALEVSGTHLVARPSQPAAPRLAGDALLGLVLDLRDEAGQRYELRIAGMSTATYWAGPRGAVRTHVLTYSRAGLAEARPLCTTDVNEAILYGGDRYDSARRTVIATGSAASGWLNIACAGTALAKLFLTRHTEASQIVPTTRVQRQAMLKMFAADLCGDGTPYTVHGQRLMWADANGITTFVRPLLSLEAVWSEHGAVCLDTPRRPDLARRLHCPRPPRCPDTLDEARSLGYVVSANPR